MNIKEITVINFGSIHYLQTPLNPQLSIIETRYLSEVSATFIHFYFGVDTSLFDDIQVEMSALYRLEKAKEELPLSEKPLLDISKYIKKNTSRGYKLWELLATNYGAEYKDMKMDEGK